LVSAIKLEDSAVALNESSDARLDRIERLLGNVAETTARQSQNIEQLYGVVQILEQAVSNVFNSIGELRADINVDLKNELIEIKETAKIQNLTSEKYAIASEQQAATARIQAENIRTLIDMLNRRQA
jgi:ABC-type transporter Mla subunit MlaD